MKKLRLVKNVQQYLDILYLFYGYFATLEAAVSKFITITHLEDYNERRKKSGLIDDIHHFNGTLPLPASDAELPQINNILQAFGALYVMEGSTLGGIIISQMMQKQLNLKGPEGFSFFTSYGNETHSKWHDFKNALSVQPDNEDEADIIINAANETFLKFKHWIENNQ